VPLLRAELESLLRARKLDRTLTSALPRAPGDPSRLAPLGVADLDGLLGGGLPRGQWSELVGPRSSGKTALLVAFLAAATARGEVVALVDALDMFDPPSGAAAGLHLERLLWIRGMGNGEWGMRIGMRHGRLNDVVDRALKATNLVLQAGGFGIVALDLADVPLAAIRRVPFTTWLRLQRVVEGSQTACVLVGPDPIARSAAGLTLKMHAAPAGGRWVGTRARARRFGGLTLCARVVRARCRSGEREELTMSVGQ